MKKLILLLALALPFNASAQKHTCEVIEESAKLIMNARQAGISMSKVMSMYKNELGRSIIRDAYSKPSYSTKEYQAKAIREFASKWASVCWNSKAGR